METLVCLLGEDEDDKTWCFGFEKGSFVLGFFTSLSGFFLAWLDVNGRIRPRV